MNQSPLTDLSDIDASYMLELGEVVSQQLVASLAVDMSPKSDVVAMFDEWLSADANLFSGTNSPQTLTVAPDLFPKLSPQLNLLTPPSETKTTPLTTTLPEFPPQEASALKCEHDFLNSLPPSIALKRRRVNAKKAKVSPCEEKTDGSDQQLDPTSLKRKKNTDAARRSRLRKTLRMEVYEQRVTELEGENARLAAALKVMEHECHSLKNRENELDKCVKALEYQLLEAHKLIAANMHRTLI
jgi:hypothetical protein